MEVKFNIICLIKNKPMTSLMQAIDTFEEFKVAAFEKKFQLKIEYKEEITKDKIDFNKVSKIIIDQTKQQEEEIIFLYILGVELDSSTYIKNLTTIPYFTKDVAVISNGTQFFLFVDYINLVLGNNFIIEEGEIRRINSIKVKTV